MDCEEFIGLCLGNAKYTDVGKLFDILRFRSMTCTYDEKPWSSGGTSLVKGAGEWKKR